MQQKRYLVSVESDVCPRETFRNDITEFITTCQRHGENIILCIDMNKYSNRTNGPLQQTLLRNNKLIDVMKYRHDIPTPATHNRGSKTIDAIFVSAPLADVESASWLRLGKGIGDHRIAFIDIATEKIIEKDRHEIARKQNRQLQVQHETSLKTYVKLCEKNFIRIGIAEKIKKNWDNADSMNPTEIETCLNEIDDARLSASLKAEQKC